jgi:hypothetical protein
MQASSKEWSSADWRILYEAAILELDKSKIVERIDEAERAIIDRMEELNHSDGSESEALMNALNAIHDLRKIANSDGQPQE